MSILGKIMGAIFGSDAKAQSAPTPPASPEVKGPAATPGTGQAAGLGEAVEPDATGATTAAQPTAAQPASTAPSGQAANVDVEDVLDRAVKANGQQLNWRTSIVDLMKALDLDSSLTARKELAADLHYTGDTNDSAAMNIWLHKALMKRLAENGGRVPDDLKS